MIIKDKSFDEERALYGIEGADIINCIFDGEADGESALKECKNIKVESCLFKLRYPFWHVSGAEIRDVTLTDTCRAALWYDEHIGIEESRLHGIKALRECKHITLSCCDIDSEEFGWRCENVEISGVTLKSMYPFFECKNMKIYDLNMTGKYSFQYVENVEIGNSHFKTKDAFWHAKNVTVYDSVIEGEYLGWYSENLRFVRCHIKGTQPLCYCKGLVLEDCTMEDADLCFERSDVCATVRGEIVSVKNPVSGFVRADGIGEIILDDGFKDTGCEICQACTKV